MQCDKNGCKVRHKFEFIETPGKLLCFFIYHNSFAPNLKTVSMPLTYFMTYREYREVIESGETCSKLVKSYS